MTNAERLLRELRQANRRGCTHRELEGAGVGYITIEIGRLEARGAVIRTERLPVSGQKRFILVREPDAGRAIDTSPDGTGGRSPVSSGETVATVVDGSPGTGTLFDVPPASGRSPYDTDAEAA